MFCIICADGFRKVIGAEQGALRSDKDEWEFFNQNFQQYQPELLENVKRKVGLKNVKCVFLLWKEIKKILSQRK